MGTKYIIEVEDKPFELLGEDGFTSEKLFRVKGFNSLVFDWNGLRKLTPYTEPDLELIKEKAHTNGYGEGYQDGYSEGMNDYLQNPEVKEESDRAYAHGYSDAESKFNEIRKEAYDKGFEDGKELCPLPKVCHNNAYQKGLSDAWEAARKIVFDDINFIGTAFGSGTRSGIIRDLTASEVIEVLKAHEQEKEEIKVWDEVINKGNFRGVVTSIDIEDEDDVMLTIFCQDGIWIKAHAQFWKKTGRTFLELAKVLEKMRNESNEQIDT